MSQVEAVEHKLKIESSEQIYNTLSNEELKTAAEMFLYLNSCPPDSSSTWLFFYENLFLYQPLDHIMLTLNRIIHSETPQDKDIDAKLWTEKLRLRTKRSLLPQKEESKNEDKDLLTSNGIFIEFLSKF